jgi:hypothetical protein
MMRTISILTLLVLAAGRLDVVEAFAVGHHPCRTVSTTLSQAQTRLSKRLRPPGEQRCASSSSAFSFLKKRPFRQSKTSLNMLLNVPEGFFTTTFFMLGLLMSISKKFARVRLEERAWEQRLAEGRARAMRNDPTLTELDLRRAEAATEWSAYGPSSSRPAAQPPAAQQQTVARSASRGRGVAVVDIDDGTTTTTSSRMNDDDIRDFERQYGVSYDPYYDDPYEEDELPEGKFVVDKQYGDRIYEDGEIFYKDSSSGLFYRQGSKPRNYRFFK